MPDILFALYLLVYFPGKNLWRSRYPPTPKPPSAALQRYWRQGRFVIALLGVLIVVMWLGHHTTGELGLDFPISRRGVWGLASACGLLFALHVIGKRLELKMTQEQRIEQEAVLRELPFSIPRTRIETIAYLATMLSMTAAWEILFRGYLLLVLTPVTGMPLAVILAAIAYGAGHGYKNPRQFAGSIAASFAFTIGYALTGSLWWLILLHAAAPVAMLYALRKMKGVQPVDEAGVCTGRGS